MYSLKPKLHERQKNHVSGNLRTIAPDVTPRCNMRCSHCYAETFANSTPVEIEILERALEEAYQLGVFHYILQGGEPIQDRERLEAILKACHPEETYINVISNGWAMTPDRIRWLKGLHVDKIAFSMDSGIEAEHDANRRPGSLKKVMAAVDNVLKEGLLSSISVVVTHQSLYSDRFRRAFDFAMEKGIRVDVQIAEPVGKWDGRRDFLMTPEDSAYIKKLQQSSPVLPNGQRMVNRDIYSGPEDHCPAGTEFMALTANGQFLPCNFLQYSLGNIREKTLGEMRADLLSSPWFDGKHAGCLCGEDGEFIDKFIMPFKNEAKPLDAYAVFGLGAGLQVKPNT